MSPHVLAVTLGRWGRNKAGHQSAVKVHWLSRSDHTVLTTCPHDKSVVSGQAKKTNQTSCHHPPVIMSDVYPSAPPLAVPHPAHYSDRHTSQSRTPSHTATPPSHSTYLKVPRLRLRHVKLPGQIWLIPLLLVLFSSLIGSMTVICPFWLLVFMQSFSLSSACIELCLNALVVLPW